MKVVKIYGKCAERDSDIIYQLSTGLKIINRDDDCLKKFKLNKWEEINFIPDDYRELSRDLTADEEKELTKYLRQKYSKYKEKSIWSRLKKALKKFTFLMSLILLEYH